MRTGRGPVDPRLWRRSAPARHYLVLTVLCEVAVTACTLAIAVLLAGTLARVITEPTVHGPAQIAGALGVLAALWSVRAAVQWVQTRFSERGAAGVIADLGDQLLTSLAYSPPRRVAQYREAAGTVLTRGLDDLRPYFTGYLPAVLSAAIVTPAAALAIGLSDPRSALIVAVTVPLIPVFMILIGLLTRDRAAAALHAATVVSGQILDLIAGIPTLRALGRTGTPLKRITELGAAQRRTTMATLRVAFLSAMVLEMIATLSVALIAVSIGLRLVFGHLDLTTALTVLILAPEVYWPLRRVGVQFHAAADGKAASDKVFEILDSTGGAGAGQPAGSGTTVAAAGHPTITIDAVSMTDRSGYAPWRLSAVVRPGSVTVLTGHNGAGKSTVLHAITGLARPDEGDILVDGISVADLDRESWWAMIGYLPQRPVLIPGTIGDNLNLFGPLDDVETALAESRFAATLERLPDGLDTKLGAGGSGLSLGERQRLCLTRTLATNRPLLLLDEPTAHLDADTEADVLAALVARSQRGTTVLLVGHRAPVLAAGDKIVTVQARRAATL